MTSNLFIKNSEIKNFISNKYNPIVNKNIDNFNFLKLKEEENLNFCDKRICSVSFKQLSCIIYNCFNNSNKIYVIVYWNRKRKINLYEVRISQDFISVYPVIKNKKLKLNVLIDKNLLYIYKLEFKKSTFKIIQERAKEILIDDDNKKIFVQNFYKKTQNNYEIKNSVEKIIKEDNINTEIENFLSNLNEEAFGKFKEEILELLTNKLEDQKYNEEIGEKVTKIINEKMDDLINKYQNNVDDIIGIYLKSIEKTIYEEKLLGLKLEKLNEYYSKNI